MTLRTKSILILALISFVYTGVLVGFMFYMTTTTISLWDNNNIEKGLVIAVNSAMSPLEQTQAERALRTYRQLKGLRGLFEWQAVGFALVLGVVLFLVSLAVMSFALVRMTRPLNELGAALGKAGEGDLDVKIAAPKSEIGRVINAYNKMTVQLKKSREDLKRAERIAAWQDVARVLAHEVRNPLTPIRLATERLVERYRVKAHDFPDILKTGSEVILSEIAALERLVKEFSGFARLPAPVMKPVAVNKLVARVAESYQDFSKNVKLKVILDPSVGDLLLDEELMKQVFSNIMKNALEAMEGVPGEIAVRTIRRGQEFCIEFEDTGRGIQPDLVDRIFEPYFTTKAKGTGLGLAVVKRIVNEHGGDVSIESELGKGTKVAITIVQAGNESEN